ncbi:MAG: transglycosylase SLT domain-containing protein [Thermoanaerobaculia bacterium]
MIWAATVLLLAAPADPRLVLTEYQLEGKLSEALAVVNQSLADSEEEVRPLGFDYLRGHLLEELGKDRAAHEAFARSLTTAMPLAPYGRFRLALNQERRGHPEVSAGLLATLLGSKPPKRLVRPAVDMLANAIENGADCRLLSGSARWHIDQTPRRRIELAKASCDEKDGRQDEVIGRLLALLEAGIDDEAARIAADRLSRILGEEISAEASILLGRALHAHRRFDLSIVYLREGLGRLEEDDLDARYALARGYFWREQYLLAATEFGKVAAAATMPEDKARALYQQGRSFELSGNWGAATASYRLSYLEETLGRWADAALLSALRIEWRIGSEDTALKLYEVLASQREWARLFERASVYLASSEIVRSRSERAGEWLQRARRARREPSIDTTYWAGRLAELGARPDEAAELYLEILTDNPYHPLALAAHHRLTAPELEATTQALARRIAAGSNTAGLYGAVLLLPAEDPAALEARRRLTARLASRRTARPFLELTLRAPVDWPLWQSSLQRPEELLLGLGLWAEGQQVILKYFTVDEPDLALTAVGLLEHSGSLRSALRIAEILFQRAVAEVPLELLPDRLLRSAFPLHYRELIRDQSTRFEVDPYLLAAIVREESRFDARAVSAASARGLAQFVLPTAERLGIKVGLETVKAEDLHRPEVALTLGAAYLDELGERFADQPYAVIAAYNAGENQATLWASYCFSREPEEYYTKVGFPETRAYLRKVLESREHYARLYGPGSGSERTPIETSPDSEPAGSK